MTMPARVWSNSLAKANRWLSELGGALGCNNEPLTLFMLRSVLHVLRDQLPADEVLRLSFPMPLIIRGVYLEGWYPAKTVVVATREGFLTLVGQRVERCGLEQEAETITRAVFKLIANRLSVAETEHLRGVLPADLADLWPRAAPTLFAATILEPGLPASRYLGKASVNR